MLMDSGAAGLDVAAARLTPARAPESTAFLLLFFPTSDKTYSGAESGCGGVKVNRLRTVRCSESRLGD